MFLGTRIPQRMNTTRPHPFRLLLAFPLLMTGTVLPFVAGLGAGCGNGNPPADEMVSIPAGTYTIGRDDGYSDEGPVHQVTLAAFEIDVYEVTNAQFDAFVRAEDCPGPAIEGNPNPCVYDGAVQSNTRSNYASSSSFNTYPVLNVRWDQAEAYCRWLGKRLPTEAEWEVAARGPDAFLYPWGDTPPDCSLANFEGCVPDAISVKGDYAPSSDAVSAQYLDPADGASPFGAIQMAGNLAEWVNDYYNETYYAWGPTDNPKGPTTGSSRVVRGGSWYCPESKVTATFRDQANPYLQYNTIGFRCAR